MLKVYTDAAVNGNPGQAGLGIVVIGDDIYEQITYPLTGKWNNHLAEFEAITLAMEWILAHGLQSQLVFIYSDSKAATDALQKGSSKNSDYQTYLDKIYALEESFQFVNLDWMPEKDNHGADHLARQALQKAIKNRK